MGSQAGTGRPDRRYSVALPARSAKRTRRKTVPDLQGKGKSRTVPVLRTVPRRGRLQGASGKRTFQNLHRRRSAAAARKTRTRAICPAVESAAARGPTIGPACLFCCRSCGAIQSEHDLFGKPVPTFPDHALEPRQVWKRELAAVHMDAAEFGAAVQGRKHLSGIEQALRVEGAFHPLLLVEVDLRNHLA